MIIIVIMIMIMIIINGKYKWLCILNVRSSDSQLKKTKRCC